MKKPTIYKLVIEDLTHLGGPMGTERTYVIGREYFLSLEKAKKFAEKDYSKRSNGETFKWKGLSSGDLSFIMYTITKIKIRS